MEPYTVTYVVEAGECSPSSSRSNTPNLSMFEPGPSGSQATTNKSKKAKSTYRMSWNNTSVSFLVGEVILRRPYQFKVKTTDQAKAWQQVAEGMQRRGYKVDARAARDRINALKEQVKAKNRREKAATGIAVEETEEEKKIREAVEEMIQEEEDIELAPKEKGDEERKKTKGEELRKRACETFGETRKRHQGECATTPRRRNSGRDTLAYLERKMEFEQELKREEMKKQREDEERRRAEEMERRQGEQARQRAEEEKRQAEEETRELRFELMQQQMQQQQQLLIQQQQQTQTMMMALIKALEKKN